MTWQVRWPAEEVVPSVDAVARAMGLPEAAAMVPRVAALVDEARAIFVRLASPRGVAKDVDHATFARLYAGGGRNDAQTPLDGIHPQAEVLVLFVATLGEPVCEAIVKCFAGRDPALGFVLDTVASEAADTLATRIGEQVQVQARQSGAASPESAALPYSPGYCGWHVSGQAALFRELAPEPHVGVVLNDSFLMQPLKSVSGVVVVGPPAIHDIVTDFDCCDRCASRQCQDRLATLPRG